jgi:hypothetical protein
MLAASSCKLPSTAPSAVCRSAAIFTGGFTAACLIGCGLAGGLHGQNFGTGINVLVGFAVGVFIFAMSIVFAFLSRSDLEQTLMEWGTIVIWAGTRNLRVTFKHDPARWESYLHIATFDVMLKYFCTPALLTLVISQAIADATKFNDGYSNYPLWLQTVSGVVVLGAMFGSFAVFALFPGFWDKIGGHIGSAPYVWMVRLPALVSGTLSTENVFCALHVVQSLQRHRLGASAWDHACGLVRQVLLVLPLLVMWWLQLSHSGTRLQTLGYLGPLSYSDITPSICKWSVARMTTGSKMRSLQHWSRMCICCGRHLRGAGMQLSGKMHKDGQSSTGFNPYVPQLPREGDHWGDFDKQN